MRESLQKKNALAWPVISLFILVAIFWHLPLLLTSTLTHSRRSSFKFMNEEPYMVLLPPSSQVAGRSFLWTDPTIYLLPSDRGFSASLRRASVSFQMVSENLPPPVLIRPFQAMWESGRVTCQDALAMMQTFFNHWEGWGTNAAGATVAEEQSVWRMTGKIAERHPSIPVSLPVVSSQELLGATVLRVGVTAGGDPRFVTLEKSSGLDKADEAAVRFVRSIRFDPLDSAADHAITWGFVKICWRAEYSPAKS